MTEIHKLCGAPPSGVQRNIQGGTASLGQPAQRVGRECHPALPHPQLCSSLDPSCGPSSQPHAWPHPQPRHGSTPNWGPGCGSAPAPSLGPCSGSVPALDQGMGLGAELHPAAGPHRNPAAAPILPQPHPLAAAQFLALLLAPDPSPSVAPISAPFPSPLPSHSDPWPPGWGRGSGEDGYSPQKFGNHCLRAL